MRSFILTVAALLLVAGSALAQCPGGVCPIQSSAPITIAYPFAPTTVSYTEWSACEPVAYSACESVTTEPVTTACSPVSCAVDACAPVQTDLPAPPVARWTGWSRTEPAKWTVVSRSSSRTSGRSGGCCLFGGCRR